MVWLLMFKNGKFQAFWEFYSLIFKLEATTEDYTISI